MKFLNFFGFGIKDKKYKKDNNLSKLKLFNDNYQNRIDEFHKELNKSVNDFNIELKNPTNKNNANEKFGIIAEKIKTGLYADKKQNFTCVQINPFLQPIEFSSNSNLEFEFIDKIDLEKIKKKGKIDHKLQKYIDIPIDFGNFNELNLDSDVTKSNYIASGPSGLFGLFHYAYANHKNIFIRPDDLWFHIVLQLQILIDKSHEELRNCFVQHKGKKEIVVGISYYCKESFIDYITQTTKLLEKDVKNDFIDIINTNFSSTSNFDANLNRVLSMCTMKHYFSYTCREICGIRNIFFGGELEDWIKIKTNLEKINDFANPILSKYINKVIPIVDKFIEAIQLKPDVEFFNKVMRQDAKLAGEFSLGYGDGSNISRYVDGWIIDLYSSISDPDRILPSSFEEYTCECDFKLEKFDGSVQNKKIYTSSGIGFKYHKELDGFSLIKAWWVLDAIDETDC